MSKWIEGIPSYRDSDVLTNKDLYKMAVDYVAEYEEGNLKLFCFSKDYDVRTGVSITGRTGYDVVYILVRSSLAPEQVKMTEFERHVLIAKSFIYGQSCYFASVGIGSKDETRRLSSLALKGDDYYYTYQGLEYVPRANYDSHEILVLQSLEELGVGYYIKNADNFKKLIGDDCKLYLEDGTIVSGYNNVCSFYDQCFLGLKEKGVKTDYFLAKSDNLPALYIEYVVDGSATGRVVYVKVDDSDGLISELRYDSPLKHKISFR